MASKRALAVPLLLLWQARHNNAGETIARRALSMQGDELI